MKKITLVLVLVLVLALSLSSCALVEKVFGKKCEEHVYDGCTDTDCNACGEERTALEHAYDGCEDTTCNNCNAERTALTHQYDGCTDAECNVCGAARQAGAHVFDNCEDTICNECSQIRAVAHTVVEVARVESTCTVAGNDKYYKCTSCDKLFANILATETLSEVPTLELAAHVTVDHEGLAPDCETAGYKAYKTCENCDYTTYTELKATGHSLTKVNGQAPTCTEGGWTEYRECTNAGCDYTTGYEALEPNGHSYENKQGLVPTCTEGGYTDYQECSVCHVTDGKTPLDAAGHQYSTDYSKDASYHWNECHCSHFEKKIVHTFTEGVCVCGLTESEFVYPCEHADKTYFERVAPTCAATGTEEYYVCNDPNCQAYLNANGEVIAAPVVIPVDSNAHALTHVDAKAPNCTEAGWEAYDYCTRCTYTTYVEVAATGHSEATLEAVAPTCTTTGLTEGKYCSECQTVLVAQTEVAATGHKYSHSCDATCDNTDCDYVRPEEELEHVYSNEYDEDCNNEGCEHVRDTEDQPGNGGTTLPEHPFS